MAAEGWATKAHAERANKVQGSTGRAGCSSNAKKRKPGRPPKLASGISRRGAGPLLGRKDTERKKRKLSDKKAPSIPSHAHARTRTRAHTRVHTHARAAQRAKGPRMGRAGGNNQVLPSHGVRMVFEAETPSNTRLYTQCRYRVLECTCRHRVIRV